MAVTIKIFPQPVVHSADYEVLISGLTPGHTHAIYTNSVASASSAATGTPDAEGNLAATITAGVATGLWFMNIIDTQGGGHVVVAQTTFTQS